MPSILDKMTHEEKVACWLHPLRGKRGEERDFGVEVGAFKTPVPGIRPFYVDRFAEYAHERVLADYYGDLCGLPFRDDSLDYVVASHVIEHVANPVKALWECARVVRHGGMVYLVVPDRRFTFDHTRALTPPEHMIADFDRGTNPSDYGNAIGEDVLFYELGIDGIFTDNPDTAVEARRQWIADGRPRR